MRKILWIQILHVGSKRAFEFLSTKFPGFQDANCSLHIVLKGLSKSVVCSTVKKVKKRFSIKECMYDLCILHGKTEQKQQTRAPKLITLSPLAPFNRS